MCSVATAWVFSQDLGFFEAILGSCFFSEGLGFFLGFSKGPWVFLGFFKLARKYIFLLFSAESKTFLAKNGQNLRNQGKKFGNQRRKKGVIRKFWRIKRHFFRKSLLFFRKSAIFSKNFPKTYRNLTLGFLGCFLLPNLWFSIFFEWQHCLC